MNRIKASFVLPVKNAEKFIYKTIQSMLFQTEKEIEIIAVNDHSQDKSAEIIQKLSVTDPRLEIIDLENSEGVAAARNLGTQLAKGEIILPSDADDPNFSNRAEISIRSLKENKVDIFYGNLMRLYTESGEKKLRHFQNYDARMLKYINIIAHSGASAYYKYVFDKIGGYDESIKVGEDYDFWLKAQELGFKFSSENIPLAQYTMHEGQVTNVNDQEKIKKRQEWNRVIREKHNIYKVDLEYVKKHATREVYDFYINKNFDIWFGENSIPKKN